MNAAFAPKDENRKILHFDLDSFFCAVEEQRNTSLRGIPFAVGGRPEARGVVASCSYPARKFGIRSAMPMSRALRLCPQLVIIPGNHKLYSETSRQVMERLKKPGRLVEQISIDEAFLDVSREAEPGEVIARRLQKKIHAQLGLPCSIGVATNKLVAKIATDVGKSAARGEGPPNAIQVVPPGKEAGFLAPLPAEALWGVGPKTAALLEEKGIRTIGDIARQTEQDLVAWFGKHGHDLFLRSRGVDRGEVQPLHETKSISRETTFARDLRDADELRKTLSVLSEGVARRLHHENLAGTTIKLKLRWADFTTLTRQVTVDPPVDDPDSIYKYSLHLFEAVWKAGRPVRLLGVGVSGLGAPIRQLTLWEVGSEAKFSEKERRLLEAIQELRVRFGDQVIRQGSPDSQDK
ncbi:MAG TPA: DNA polymerase IV [Anaerolineales bacterium]|jgi:DNA polymerase-4|nr:DNA polymerase IV [Anaerolineales bacterium]